MKHQHVALKRDRTARVAAKKQQRQGVIPLGCIATSCDGSIV